MQIAVIGGGAMGSLWASLLGLTGVHNLWVVERDFARYSICKEKGYLLFHGQKPSPERVQIRMAQDISDLPLAEIGAVILAVKAYQVDDVLGVLLPLLLAGTPVLCLANGAGFGGEGLIAAWQDRADAKNAIAKLGQVFFAVSFQGAYLKNPGEVYLRGAGPIYWGSLPPACGDYLPDGLARERLRDILSVVGGCSYRQDFPVAMWQKLLVNGVINPLSSLWRVANGGLADTQLTEAQRLVKHKLLQEGLAVGFAYGKAVLDNSAFLSADAVERALAETIGATAENYSSMYQDITYGRQTEIDYINGYLIRWGQRLGVSTPCHQEVYQQMKTIFSA